MSRSVEYKVPIQGFESCARRSTTLNFQGDVGVGVVGR